MKRKLAVLMALTLGVTSLFGCTQSAKDVTPAETPATEEAVVEETPAEAAPEDLVFDNLYPDFITAETEETVTFIDHFGTETIITKNPKKVVIGYNSILGLWYFSGGQAMTKAKGSTNVPEEAMDNIDIGSSRDLGLETIISLEPDLVILSANVSGQVALAPILKESGIETMIIDTTNNSFDRFKENAYLFSKVNNTSQTYEANMTPIMDDINEIIEKAAQADHQPNVAAMFATKSSISLDSDIALTGEMIKALGGNNILNSEDIAAEGETRIPFSIEALITDNPEIIMISTMGTVEDVEAFVNTMIEENPAWNEVEAVKNGKVFYLPKEYSVYKPNEKYADAFRHIATIMYPELFGDE